MLTVWWTQQAAQLRIQKWTQKLPVNRCRCSKWLHKTVKALWRQSDLKSTWFPALLHIFVIEVQVFLLLQLHPSATGEKIRPHSWSMLLTPNCKTFHFLNPTAFEQCGRALFERCANGMECSLCDELAKGSFIELSHIQKPFKKITFS